MWLLKSLQIINFDLARLNSAHFSAPTVAYTGPESIEKERECFTAE